MGAGFIARVVEQTEMKGETTAGERTTRNLERLEELRKHYASRFPGIGGKAGWEENFVSQLVYDAAWLSIYYGLDLETMVEQTVRDARRDFPDIPG